MNRRIDPIALIGLDWGSTHLRGYAFDAAGNVTARAQSTAGALSLTSPQHFDDALVALVGDWARAHATAPLIACGMVGAKSGWREVSYVSLAAPGEQSSDAQLAALAAALVPIPTSLARPLHIIPGVRSDEPDVMRGEETQLVGCTVVDGVVVLPGTHCKWVRMAGGVIERFATFYTGEMNSLLRAHSSVGAALRSAPTLDDRQAFAMGLHHASTGAATWLHDLFVLRAAVVTGQYSEAFVSTALAGWLLGCEISAALTMYPNTQHVSLVASEPLVPWYEAACRSFGVTCHAVNAADASARGLWRVARRAMLCEHGPMR